MHIPDRSIYQLEIKQYNNFGHAQLRILKELHAVHRLTSNNRNRARTQEKPIKTLALRSIHSERLQ